MPRVPTDPSAVVDETIRRRRTLKVLADEAHPLPINEDVRPVVEALLEAAGRAPFHRPAAEVHRGALPSLLPWRCYALDAAACRGLLAHLRQQGTAAGKITGMLAAADALVLTTWLPNPPDAGAGLFEPTVENMEHVAAAGAAIQNLLLAATARGIRSFWSSGGVLRRPEAFAVLGIPPREILLGAVFLFPDPPEGVTTLVSKLADRRGEVHEWMRWVTPAEAPA